VSQCEEWLRVNEFQINCLLLGVCCCLPMLLQFSNQWTQVSLTLLRSKTIKSCIQHKINCLMSTKISDSSIDIYQVVKMVVEVWCVNVSTTSSQKCWKHVGMIFGGTSTSTSTDTSSIIAFEINELVDVSMLLSRLS
jgi:hypothetical protein